MTAQRRCGGDLLESFAIDAQLPTTTPSEARPNSDVNTTAGDLGWDNAPEHYKGAGLENFDVWDAYELDPYTANAFKYLARWDKKDSAVNDLKKAHHYIREFMAREALGTVYMGVDLDIPQELSPEAVTRAFRLSGPIAAATRDLLYSRLVPNYTPFLEDALSLIEGVLKELNEHN